MQCKKIAKAQIRGNCGARSNLSMVPLDKMKIVIETYKKGRHGSPHRKWPSVLRCDNKVRWNCIESMVLSWGRKIEDPTGGASIILDDELCWCNSCRESNRWAASGV